MGHMDWIRGFVGGLLLAMILGLRRFDLDDAGERAADRRPGRQRRSLDAQALFHRNRSGVDRPWRRRPARRRASTPTSAPSSSTARSWSPSAAARRSSIRVAFEGNSKIETKQLEVEVQSKPHTAYNEETAVGDVGRIKDAYKKYGRNEAQVTKRLVQLPNGRVDLVFTIDEGGKTGIRDIKFVGNHAVSNYRLRGLMQTSTMNLLSWHQEHRRLRSRSSGLRRGGDPPLLHEERLCRLPHRQYRRHLPGQSSRLHHHDHDGRGPAIPRVVRQRGLEHPEGRRAGARPFRRP